MEKENFSQILKKRVKSLGFTQNSLAAKLGITQPQVNNFLSGRERLGMRNAARVAAVLDVDQLWLMSQGEQGKAPMEDTPANDDVVVVPVYNFDARGGSLANEEVDVEQYRIGKQPFTRSQAREGDFVVPVSGDSMAPDYPNGSYVLLRPVEMWREWLEFGKAYVLELKDGRRTIKFVRAGDDEEHWWLISRNPKFDDTELPVSMVWRVYEVVLSVNKLAM